MDNALQRTATPKSLPPSQISKKSVSAVLNRKRRYNLQCRITITKRRKVFWCKPKECRQSAISLPSVNTYTFDDSSSSDRNSVSPQFSYVQNQAYSPVAAPNIGFGPPPLLNGPQFSRGHSFEENHFPFEPVSSNVHFTNAAFPIESNTTQPNTETEDCQPTQREPLYSVSRNKRTLNPLPRHKRVSHINAEVRRRTKIQTGFDTLKDLVPALRNSEGVQLKESKSAMLFTAAEYCRQLKSESDRYEEDKAALRKEIGDLNNEIKYYQSELPAGGVHGVEKPRYRLDKMFNEYILKRVTEDWRFWIFSLLVRPLFEQYNKMVSSNTYPEFFRTVKNWSDEHLCLVSLRPRVLTLLREISTKTSIMTTPDSLPQEALEQCFRTK